MSRKCSSSTWVVSRRSSPGDRRQQRVADPGLGRDQLAEPVARQDDGLGRADRGRTGRPRRSVEQCQLAEHVARRERREDGLLAGLGRAARSSRRPSTITNSASPGSPRWKITSPRRNRRDAHAGGEPLERLGLEAREERDRPQCIQDRASDQHAGDGNRVEQPTHHLISGPDSMPAMTDTLGARLRLTVLGCSTAAPHPATPTAGYLVEWGSTAVLLDCGQGVIRNLQKVLDPHDLSGIVIGHMHADHYLDIVGLRYLYPWGEPAPVPLPHPPAARRTRPARRALEGRQRAGRLLRCRLHRPRIRPGCRAPDRRAAAPVRARPPLRPGLGRGHRCARTASRLAYTGDTGPSASVEEAVRDADLLLVESALGLAAHDDPERGHLTPEEAIELARRANARNAILVHYGPARRAEMDRMCAEAGPWVPDRGRRPDRDRPPDAGPQPSPPNRARRARLPRSLRPARLFAARDRVAHRFLSLEQLQRLGRPRTVERRRLRVVQAAARSAA